MMPTMSINMHKKIAYKAIRLSNSLTTIYFLGSLKPRPFPATQMVEEARTADPQQKYCILGGPPLLPGELQGFYPASVRH